MRLNDLDLNLLKTFVYVAEEASFTKAAKKLFVEQSAVSKAIKKLEADLRTELFKRTKRSVRLTSKGVGLLPLARAMLQSGEEFLKFSQDQSNEVSGTLQFGAESPLSIILLPDIVSKVSVDYPKLWPMMYTGITEDIVNRVINRKLEFSLLLYEGKRVKELEYLELGLVSFRVVASSKIQKEALNSFIGSREINDSDSPNLPTFARLKRLNKSLQIKYSANDIAAYKQLVMKGLGIGLLPVHMVVGEIKQKKLKVLYPEMKLHFPVYLVRHASYPLSQEATCMVELVNNELKNSFSSIR
jgi:DNA-binding transcriptional LysR family regulator